MPTNYKPYETSSFTELMRYFYNLGWYGGCRELLTIKLLGEFEGFSGHASETWEHLVVLSNCAIPEIHVEAHEVRGDTLEEASNKLLKLLKG